MPPIPTKNRIRTEDALKHLYDCGYTKRSASVESVAGALAIPRAEAAELLASLQEGNLVKVVSGSFILTGEGIDYALQVIRAHRLYETYLARESGLSADEWHSRAHEAEHHLTVKEVDDLADRLGRPRYDPHGDPIPTRTGHVAEVHALNLLEWKPGETGVVLHIEDEPASIFKRIFDTGIFPGMRISVRDKRGQNLSLGVEGRTVQLPRDAAAQISLGTLSHEDSQRAIPARLSDLKPGQMSEVVGLSPHFRGAERTRLLDLGFVPGSVITRAFASPLSSPIAYQIRGTLVALREEQAEHVYMRTINPA
ncbi:MAG: metal-dependent transcriptional regulator [Verrucomicrobiota bacterium]|nr:metal-dependent transcriptional regulator [Verrucomicrobiota bacterium]